MVVFYIYFYIYSMYFCSIAAGSTGLFCLNYVKWLDLLLCWEGQQGTSTIGISQPIVNCFVSSSTYNALFKVEMFLECSLLVHWKALIASRWFALMCIQGGFLASSKPVDLEVVFYFASDASFSFRLVLEISEWISHRKGKINCHCILSLLREYAVQK